MTDKEIKNEVFKLSAIVKNIDESITNNLVKEKYASNEFKYLQRISNNLLNVIRSIDVLKYDL